MFIWDEMVHRGLVRDPTAVADLIESGGQDLYTFVENSLGRPAVSELFSTSFFCDLHATYSFIDFTVAQCFPDDLHIVDIEFADVRRPIKQGVLEKGQRNFHGLHIFPEFIDRLQDVANSRNVSRLSAVAVDEEVRDVFARQGFRVSDTPAAQMAQIAGMGIPMIRESRRRN